MNTQTNALVDLLSIPETSNGSLKDKCYLQRLAQSVNEGLTFINNPELEISGQIEGIPFNSNVATLFSHSFISLDTRDSKSVEQRLFMLNNKLGSYNQRNFIGQTITDNKDNIDPDVLDLSSVSSEDFEKQARKVIDLELKKLDDVLAFLKIDSKPIIKYMTMASRLDDLYGDQIKAIKEREEKEKEKFLPFAGMLELDSLRKEKDNKFSANLTQPDFAGLFELSKLCITDLNQASKLTPDNRRVFFELASSELV